MTTTEAAAYLGVLRTSVVQAVARGRIRGEKPGGYYWLLERRSVEAYRRERDAFLAELHRPRPARAPHGPCLSAEPLLRLVDGSGGPTARRGRAGEAQQKAVARARRDGWVTYQAADKLTTRLLGLTPWEVWGETYDA